MPRAAGPEVALLDGDLIAYRCAAAIEREFDWGDGLWTLHSELGDAQGVIRNQIDEIMETLGTKRIRAAFSGSNNFRKLLSPAYKANRKDKRLPVAYRALSEWMIAEYDGFRKTGIEADDVLGIWQTKAAPLSTVIVSGDKDMATIPGFHFNWLKDHGLRKVTPTEAARFHMMQTLMGDAADNIPGLPGCGPVRAEKILGTESDPTMMWELVCDAYIAKGLNPDDALLNARLTRILQVSDYNFDTGEIKYWNPPE